MVQCVLTDVKAVMQRLYFVPLTVEAQPKKKVTVLINLPIVRFGSNLNCVRIQTEVHLGISDF